MGKLGPGPQYAYEDNIKYKDVSGILMMRFQNGH